jgi:ABC-2 type transport system ATP-binding protein
MSSTVSIRDLRKSFAGKRVLDGLDLHVDAGEIVGFLGPNGAGKSTCLRVLVGLVDRDGGDVTVHGIDPRVNSLGVRRLTSYLPGETSVYGYMTGGEFLDFALGFYSATRALPPPVAAAFELPLDRKVRTYSAGMKQKLALRATLCAEVDLYVLDEPDRALDASARFALREVLLDLRTAGKSILLSSHHMSEVEALADRSVFLFRGKSPSASAVAAARADLRRDVRLRLTREVALPPGTRSVEREPDGTLRVQTIASPYAWLAQFEDGVVDAAEIGATRLERIYRFFADSADAVGTDAADDPPDPPDSSDRESQPHTEGDRR